MSRENAVRSKPIWLSGFTPVAARRKKVCQPPYQSSTVASRVTGPSRPVCMRGGSVAAVPARRLWGASTGLAGATPRSRAGGCNRMWDGAMAPSATQADAIAAQSTTPCIKSRRGKRKFPLQVWSVDVGQRHSPASRLTARKPFRLSQACVGESRTPPCKHRQALQASLQATTPLTHPHHQDHKGVKRELRAHRVRAARRPPLFQNLLSPSPNASQKNRCLPLLLQRACCPRARSASASALAIPTRASPTNSPGAAADPAPPHGE